MVEPNYPEPFYVEEIGHKVRSSWEAKIAIMLKRNDIDYEYEEKKFKVKVNEKNTYYLPDFIVDDKIIVEPHNFGRLKKYEAFYQQHKSYFFIIVSNKDFSNCCDIYYLGKKGIS